MRGIIVALSVVFMMALAFWAYRENYRTQGQLADLRALQTEVGELRENLSVLKAEWAYLNRPDRLRDLANANFTRLGLLPLQPAQFGTANQIAFPAEGLPPGLVTNPIATSATVGGTP